MTTPDSVRALVVLPDDDLLNVATTKYEQTTILLENALTSIAGLARLIFIAKQHNNFTVSAQGKLIQTQSFVGSIMQVANDSCTTLASAAEQFQVIQTTAGKMPELVRDLVSKVEDLDARKLVAGTLTNNAADCVTIASNIMDQFFGVSNLIDEIVKNLVATKNGDPQVTTVVDETTKQLQVIKGRWDQNIKYLNNVHAYFRAYLRSDAADLRSAAIGVISSPAQRNNFAKKATTLVRTSVRVAALAEGFGRVRDICWKQSAAQLIAMAKSQQGDFLQLEKESVEAAGGVRNVVAKGKEDLVATIREQTTLLQKP